MTGLQALYFHLKVLSKSGFSHCPSWLVVSVLLITTPACYVFSCLPMSYTCTWWLLYNAVDWQRHSLHFEDYFRSGCRNVSHQQQFFQNYPHLNDLLIFLGSNHLRSGIFHSWRVFVDVSLFPYIFNPQEQRTRLPGKWRLSRFDEGSGVSLQASCHQTHHPCHGQPPCQSQ